MGGTPDIGAYEAGTCNSYENWIWETLPTTGRTYTLLQSATLQGGSWEVVPGIGTQAGIGSPHTFQVPIGSGKMFFQVRVSVP